MLTNKTKSSRKAKLAGVSPLSNYDFRLILGAQVISELGDWAARIALAALVLNRTGSAALSAFVVAVAVAPLLAGPLLSYLADRYPKKLVMVISDLLRAVLFMLIALWDAPTAVTFGLVFLAGLAAPPFGAARVAILPELFPHDVAVHRRAQSWSQGTNQAMLAIGLGLGGLLVELVGPRPALLLNAASFGLSALLLIAMKHRSAISQSSAPLSAIKTAARAIMSDPLVIRAATLPIFGTLGAYAAEALVVAYSREYLGGSWLALLAVLVPLATLIGYVIIERKAFEMRRGLLVSPKILMAGNLLMLIGLIIPLPPLLAAIIVYTGAGIVFSPFILSIVVVVHRVPNNIRGSVAGLLQASLSTGVVLSSAIAAGLTSITAPAYSILLLVICSLLYTIIVDNITISEQS